MYFLLLTVLSWIVFLISALIMLPVAAITYLVTFSFDKRLTANHMISCIWGSILTWLNPLWNVKVEGRKKIHPERPVVFIANHQSMLDILVLYRLFTHFKWVSKSEIFKVPVVGWNMKLNRYVAVERGNKASHLKMMEECEEHLGNGSSIMIFPEGTRSKDGEIHAFKEGAFRLALSGEVQIIPILVDGTLHGFPKKGVIYDHKCRIRVHVMDPVPYESFRNLSPRELAESMRLKMMQTLNLIREH